MSRTRFVSLLLALAAAGTVAGSLVAQSHPAATQRPMYGCQSTSSCGSGNWSDCSIRCTQSGCVCRQGLTDL